MAIYNTAITATSEGSAQILDSGSNNRAITTIIVCNTEVADRTLTLYAIPTPGTTASSANMIVKALTIPAGDTISFDQEKMVLATGDEIRAICSASGLTATVSTLAV
jgi:hypothetical protein